MRQNMGKVVKTHHQSKLEKSVLQSTDALSCPGPSPSILSVTQDDLHSRLCEIFAFVDDIYRELRRLHSKLHKNLHSNHLIRMMNKYRNGCNEAYVKILDSYHMCHKLAQNIVRTIDIFRELCTCLSDLEEYNYRMCEIMSIFIACELRLSIDATQQEQLLVAQRIIYIMRIHLVKEEEHETLYNILRTLVYIPKLFNARNIMCAIFGEFIPMKTVLEVKVLPDKLYMLYIIIFYRWMMMRKDDNDKMLIVNFAESFMKPSVSLCSNKLYGSYLPVYTTHSTATRTILTNLKYYRDIRNASIIDNALKNIKTFVNLCDDEEDNDIIVLDTSPPTNFVEVFAEMRLEFLSYNMSKIKLEEETVVSTVDLTEEDGPENSEISITSRHEKWLNAFYRLAMNYRESQELMEKQHNNRDISSGEKEISICIDSDSEEDVELSTRVNKEMQEVASPSQHEHLEILLFDDYFPTSASINYDSGLESSHTEDENDCTKTTPRFLQGALRTYRAKKNYLLESEGKNHRNTSESNKSYLNKACSKDSVHSATMPLEMLQTVDEGHKENEDVVNETGKINKIMENDILSQQIQPIYDKAISKTIPGYPQEYQNKQCHSNSSEIKVYKKQKKKVQFNTKLVGSTALRASQKPSPKYILQQPKNKTSGATNQIENFSNQKFENSATYNTKKYKHHNNQCLNFDKNQSVFKQNSLNMNIEQKCVRNVKILLKRLKLNNDNSIHNFKSNLININLKHSNTDPTGSKPESFQMKSKTEDDIIFKKPLPVAKKIFKHTKRFKMPKVVLLRTDQIHADDIEMETPLDDTKPSDSRKVSQKLRKEINSLTCEIAGKENVEETNEGQFDLKSQTDKELSKNEPEISLQNDLIISTCAGSRLEAEDIDIQKLEKQESLIADTDEQNNELANDTFPKPTSIKENKSSLNEVENVKSNKNSSKCSEANNIEETSSNMNNKSSSVKKEVFTNENFRSNETANTSFTDETEKSSQANREQPADISSATIKTKPVVNRKCEQQEKKTLTVQIKDKTFSNSKKLVKNSAKKVVKFKAKELLPFTNAESNTELDAVSVILTPEEPATVPGKEIDEPRKLSTDLNNETKNIVGTSFDKKSLVCEFTVLNSSYNSPLASDSRFSNPNNTLHDMEDITKNQALVVEFGKQTQKESPDKTLIDTDQYSISESTKKDIFMPSVSKCLKSNENKAKLASPNYNSLIDQPEEIFIKDSKSSSENKNEIIETSDVVLHDHEQMISNVIQSENKLNKTPLSIENSASIVESQSDNPSIGIEENEKQTERLMKDKKITTQQTETPINENEPMIVELSDSKEECQNDGKRNDGASAALSFPKIPIISISILTTPNNKTYFKISNRDNDNKTIEDGKTKKTSQPENEGQSKHDEQSISNEISEPNGIKSEEKALQGPLQETHMKDNQDAERGEEEDDGDEEDIDNFDIDKYSHDSNSACALPLKKRPTQAETNDDVEDSQSMGLGNCEQLQEVPDDNTFKQATLEQKITKNNTETGTQENKETAQENNEKQNSNLHIDCINKRSTSPTHLKKLTDSTPPFEKCGSNGQTPTQSVAPQLKDSSLSPSNEHRITAEPAASTSRLAAQDIPPLPESYPATPMLSVANVEKLMNFNRFIEDLLASSDVMSVTGNASDCGYYVEGQTYEAERMAILEHYNIANAKGSNSATKQLYWKKSAGDTISIFNDNDNEWISLPPSTAKQLQKLSFVLSILQRQYKATDLRQRINIALTFLIRNTAKYKNDSNSSLPQKRTSYFRANNQTLNTAFEINSNTECVPDFQTASYSSKNQQHPEMRLHLEPAANNNNQNRNTNLQFASCQTEQINSVQSPQKVPSSNVKCDHHQQNIPSQDKRNSCLDELNSDQIYINPPCATSPQSEVIVNTNGVELHEMPQDQQNIFIKITDDAGALNANAESSSHKYSIRQQQQQLRASHDSELLSSIGRKSYGKRPCLGNKSFPSMSNHFVENTIITAFGNQELQLENPYRMQQRNMTSQNFNASLSQRNTSPQKTSMNIYNTSINSSPLLTQQQLRVQAHIPARFTNSFNTQQNSSGFQQNQTKHNNDSNYKEILQPYITYLIKDHEKTSKHLLQVFEEVTNSNSTSNRDSNNFNQTQLQNHQLSNSSLPPLIRNPQQSHTPGVHQISGSSSCSILPSLVRNPHQSILTDRDSGALQVVQSFLEQSQTSYDAINQPKYTDLPQQDQPTTSSRTECVDFVASRDELAQKSKLRNFNIEKNEKQLQQQQNEQFLQRQQGTQRTHSIKRKCQEKNDKLAEALKRKMMEFSLVKHNVQLKLLEKQQIQEKTSTSNIKRPIETIKRRGRPRKITKTQLKDNAALTMLPYTDRNANSNYFSSRDKSQNKDNTRVTRSNQTNSDLLPASTTTDYTYFRQRSAAREAAKRINATLNSIF